MTGKEILDIIKIQEHCAKRVENLSASISFYKEINPKRVGEMQVNVIKFTKMVDKLDNLIVDEIDRLGE